MKQVGVKIEDKGRYNYYVSSYSVEERLRELVKTLKEDEAIEIKCGQEHHYIDYDEEQDVEHDIFAYWSEIERIMYYVRSRLGRY